MLIPNFVFYRMRKLEICLDAKAVPGAKNPFKRLTVIIDQLANEKDYCDAQISLPPLGDPTFTGPLACTTMELGPTEYITDSTIFEDNKQLIGFMANS